MTSLLSALNNNSNSMPQKNYFNYLNFEANVPHFLPPYSCKYLFYFVYIFQ